MWQGSFCTMWRVWFFNTCIATAEHVETDTHTQSWRSNTPKPAAPVGDPRAGHAKDQVGKANLWPYGTRLLLGGVFRTPAAARLQWSEI